MSESSLLDKSPFFHSKTEQMVLGTKFLQLPGYQLQEKIHQNQQSLIYRAIREEDQISVIIKTISSHQPVLGDLGRFHYANKVIQEIQQKNICQPYELLLQERCPILVMEDIQASSLKEQLLVPIAFEQKLELAMLIADALGQLHQLRIIHNDIRPSNILWKPSKKHIQFIDFELAWRLPHETPKAWRAFSKRSDLLYASPEQTGDMDRSIDHRSDLYALGIIYYELFTEKMPFDASFAKALIHSHTSIVPPSPHTINPEVPLVLSQIIKKLLEKLPTDRYQNAYVLKQDLEQCFLQYKKNQNIQHFEIAQHDLSPRLQISKKLYEREKEKELLTSSFSRIQKGNTELVLLSGYAGIGKTSLLQDFQRSVAQRGGIFLSGKYDQVHNTPHEALLQASRRLLRQLLNEPQNIIDYWSDLFHKSLGHSIYSLAEAIPDIKYVIPPQPVQPKTQSFQTSLRQFVQSIGKKEHPLLLFLDDVQWAREEDVQFIQQLLKHKQSNHLLIVCAYRSNQIEQRHPFRQIIESVEKREQTATHIDLPALTQVGINALLLDTFNQEEEKTLKFAELLFQQTHGNPFFVERFLMSIYENNHLYMDTRQRQWCWDLEKLRSSELTDNVLALVQWEFKHLPPKTQELLQWASCLGNTFNLSSLSSLTKQASSTLTKELWPAIHKRFIHPNDFPNILPENCSTSGLHQNYNFSHDQIQQSIYDQIPPQSRQQLHYQIGTWLYECSSDLAKENRVFEIADHFNLGVQLHSASGELSFLAQLNLDAGQRAFSADAFQSASLYYENGINYISENGWIDHSELLTLLYQELAQTKRVLKQNEKALQIEKLLLQKHPHKHERFQIYLKRLQRLIELDQKEEAIETGLQALSLFDFEAPKTASDWEKVKQKEQQELDLELQHRNFSEILDLPANSNHNMLRQCSFLSELLPLLQERPLLQATLVTRFVRFSVSYGHHLDSPKAYILYASFLAAQEDYQKAEQFSQLAIQLNQQQGEYELAPKLLHKYSCYICHWSHPLSYAIEQNENAISMALNQHSYSAVIKARTHQIWLLFFQGISFKKLFEKIENTLRLLQNLPLNQNQSKVLEKYLPTINKTYEIFKALSSEPSKTSELQAEIEKEEFKDKPELQAYLQIALLKTAFIFGEKEDIERLQTDLVKIPNNHQNLASLVDYYFFQSLYFHQKSKTKELLAHEEKIRKEAYRKLQKWSQLCPENALAKYSFLLAQRAESSHDQEEALKYLEQASIEAQNHKNSDIFALSLEFIAQIYIKKNKPRAAKGYLQDAISAYHDWGFTTRAENLQKLFGLLYPNESPTLQKQEHALLDMSSLLRQTQLLTSDLTSAASIGILLRIATQITQAERSIFILNTDKGLSIEAILHFQEISLQSIQLREEDLCLKIIQFVERSRKHLEVENPEQDPRFSESKYILLNQPQKIFCTPLFSQNKLFGILYFENAQSSLHFSIQQQALIDFTSSLATIVLQHSNRKRQLEAEGIKRKRELRSLKSRMEEQHEQFFFLQNQLIRSEKFAKIGTLLIGFAHEISNPTQFLYGGTQNIKRHLKSLQDMFEELFEEAPEAEEIKIFQKKFHSLFKNVEVLFEGSQRIKEIASDLRTFAQKEKKNPERIDPNLGIRSTVSLLQTNYKQDIDFELQLLALPRILCWPSQLNQVFLNLLINACHAIMLRQQTDAKPQRGQILISSQRQDNWLRITFQDNGGGMSAQVQEKLFEPFFTTKGADGGTGLGLSVSRSIIEQHKGSLQVSSTEGKETIFTIKLPIDFEITDSDSQFPN